MVPVHENYRENGAGWLSQRHISAADVYDTVIVLAVPLGILDGGFQASLIEVEHLCLRTRLQPQQPVRRMPSTLCNYLLKTQTAGSTED